MQNIDKIVKYFFLFTISIIIIFLFSKYCCNKKNISERYENSLDILKDSISKKYYDIKEIYKYEKENILDFKAEKNLAEIIDNNILNSIGIPGLAGKITGKILNFSAGLKIKNLLFGIYGISDLQLSLINKKLNYTGSMSMKLKIDKCSLNNINLFGINLGEFDISPLEVKIEATVNAETTLIIGMNHKKASINTKITIEKPRLVFPDVSTITNNFINNFSSILEYKLNCPVCGDKPDCGWLDFPCEASWVGCQFARQGCLGADAIQKQAHYLSEKGILSLIFKKVPDEIQELVTTGLSNALITPIINNMPSIISGIEEIFNNDPDIKSKSVNIMTQPTPTTPVPTLPPVSSILFTKKWYDDYGGSKLIFSSSGATRVDLMGPENTRAAPVVDDKNNIVTVDFVRSGRFTYIYDRVNKTLYDTRRNSYYNPY